MPVGSGLDVVVGYVDGGEGAGWENRGSAVRRMDGGMNE